MSIKTVLLVIIVSALIGVAIFFGGNAINSSAIKNASLEKTTPALTQDEKTIYPSEKPFPAPSYPGVDGSTDLKSALENAGVPDFSSDYQKIKEEINSL